MKTTCKNFVMTGLLILTLGIGLSGCNLGSTTPSTVTANCDLQCQIQGAAVGPVSYSLLRTFMYDIPGSGSTSADVQANVAVTSIKISNGGVANSVIKTGFIGGVLGSVNPLAGAAFGTLATLNTAINNNNNFNTLFADINSINNELAYFQGELNTFQQSQDTKNNIFFNYIVYQDNINAQAALKAFNADLQSVSFAPVSNNDKNANVCFSTGSVYTAYMYKINPNSISCGNITQFNQAAVAANSNTMDYLNNDVITNSAAYVTALQNISNAYTPANYTGSFNSVQAASSTTDIVALYQAMYKQLADQIPQQGAPTTNIVPIINEYNQAVVSIYWQAINALQGAYTLEATNNYLNYLNAESYGGTAQINGYENLNSINFNINNLTSLSSDYTQIFENTQEALVYAYIARFNLLHQITMQYIISDQPVGNFYFPSTPTSFTFQGTTYPITLPSYAEMYSHMIPAKGISGGLYPMPNGNWKLLSVLYQFGEINEVYKCDQAYLNGESLTTANCPTLLPGLEGQYDGANLSVYSASAQNQNNPTNGNTGFVAMYDCNDPATDTPSTWFLTGQLMCSTWKNTNSKSTYTAGGYPAGLELTLATTGGSFGIYYSTTQIPVTTPFTVINISDSNSEINQISSTLDNGAYQGIASLTIPINTINAISAINLQVTLPNGFIVPLTLAIKETNQAGFSSPQVADFSLQCPSQLLGTGVSCNTANTYGLIFTTPDSSNYVIGIDPITNLTGNNIKLYTTWAPPGNYTSSSLCNNLNWNGTSLTCPGSVNILNYDNSCFTGQQVEIIGGPTLVCVSYGSVLNPKPTGPFTGSCTDITTTSLPTNSGYHIVTASCNNGDGTYVFSSILNNGTSISNGSGLLFNNNPYGVIGGSYTASCTNVFFDDSSSSQTFYATCGTGTVGNYVENKISTASCGANAPSNEFGIIGNCNGNGATPQGNFSQNCSLITWDNTTGILTGYCGSNNTYSTLDFYKNCAANSVVSTNSNNKLTCS